MDREELKAAAKAILICGGMDLRGDPLWEAVQGLARDYLAEHPADDEEPVTMSEKALELADELIESDEEAWIWHNRAAAILREQAQEIARLREDMDWIRKKVGVPPGTKMFEGAPVTIAGALHVLCSHAFGYEDLHNGL